MSPAAPHSDAPHPADPILDRLLRHMAWANQRVFEVLATLPDAALEHTEPGSEWTVAMTLEHLVAAAGGYAARLERSERPASPEVVTTTAQLPALAALCADRDARLRVAAALPDRVDEYVLSEGTVTRARSTILAQSIHHATEHRAQIAGALAANGVTALSLDDLDLWAFGDVEARGE